MLATTESAVCARSGHNVRDICVDGLVDTCSRAKIGHRDISRDHQSDRVDAKSRRKISQIESDFFGSRSRTDLVSRGSRRKYVREMVKLMRASMHGVG